MCVVLTSSSACRTEARDPPAATASATESETGEPTRPPGPLCASLGLDANAALLVTRDDERVVIVRADGSTIDLDVHPPDASADSRYAGFALSPAGIATSTSFRSVSSDTRMVAASLFGLDGTRAWAMQWEQEFGDITTMISPTGDVAISLLAGMVSVRGDEVQTYATLVPLAAPIAGFVPASRRHDGDVIEYGWVDLEARSFVPASMRSSYAEAYDGRLVGVYDGTGPRLEVSSPGEAAREIRFESDEMLSLRNVDGRFALLADTYAFTTVGIVDLDSGELVVEPLVPPEGLHTMACGWPSLDADDLLIPLSDGETLSLWRRTIDGEWTAMPLLALSGVPGGRARAFGGTYFYTSIESAHACGDDDVLPDREGTLVGPSSQIARPESGVSFAWSDEATAPWVLSTHDGRCAARQTDDGLMVLDMVDGEMFELDVPADFVEFVD